MKIIKYVAILIAVESIFGRCLADNNLTNSPILVRVNGQELRINRPEMIVTTKAVETLVAQRIKHVIIDSALTNSNITVPDEVLSNCVDLYVQAGGENPANVVNIVSSKSAIIVDALRKVILGHQDKDEVYHNFLQKIMSREDWQVWLDSYNTKEKIDKLEHLTPHSVADLKRFSTKSLKRDIEVWLLFNQITKNVSPSSEEIHARYEKEYPNGIPQFVKVEDEVKEEATRELKETALNGWWQGQISKAKISVPSELSQVNQLVNVPPASPFLPASIVSLLKETYSN